MIQPDAPVHNLLLNMLPPRELAQLRAYLDRVPLKARRVLHHWNMPLEDVYFVESGLVSVVARVDGGQDDVEVWSIGREGMTGVPVLLGGDATPLHKRVVQVGGSALRIRADEFRRVVDTLPALRSLLLRYVQVVLIQTSQSAACNAQHSLQQRLARWLATAQDRLDGDDIPVTHSMLSRLLGVRRASVTEAVSAFDEAGVLGQARGHIRILDGNRLRGMSCDCYRTIRGEYDRLLDK